MVCQPTSQFRGACLPTNECNFLYDIELNGNKAFYVDGARLCKETLTYPAQSEPHFGGRLESVRNSQVFNAAFDSHYCHFPSEPWVTDRFATPAGYSAADSCYIVNHKNAVGQRLALERCVAADLNVPIVRFGERDEECIRYYNSLLCTSMCPEYGVGTDFSKLCHNYCARLEQVCTSSLLSCLQDETLIPIKCAAKGVVDCDAPNLIPTAGLLEYELCFYGDQSRCVERDCVLAPASLIDDDFAIVNATAPCCRGFQSGCNGNAQCNSVSLPQESSVGFAYAIVQRNKIGGKTCEEVAQQKAINALGGTAYVPIVWCSQDLPGVPQKCFTSATKRATSGLPTYCDQITDPETCPTFYFDNCAQVSEGQSLLLSCPTGLVIKQITFANFGRPVGSCGFYSAGTACNSGHDWRAAISSSCSNKNSCSFGVSNGVTGDPCGGIFKWASVEYRCGTPISSPPPA